MRYYVRYNAELGKNIVFLVIDVLCSDDVMRKCLLKDEIEMTYVECNFVLILMEHFLEPKL